MCRDEGEGLWHWVSLELRVCWEVGGKRRLRADGVGINCQAKDCRLDSKMQLRDGRTWVVTQAPWFPAPLHLPSVPPALSASVLRKCLASVGKELLRAPVHEAAVRLGQITFLRPGFSNPK